MIYEQEEECYEGIFIRNDGELEPIIKNLFVISSSNLEKLIDTICRNIEIDGTIEVYKKFSHLENSIFYKAVQIYSNLEPLYK
ncbi:MAG: hypothetical protein ACFFAS_05055 [Promethearchaeota archaeon]